MEDLNIAKNLLKKKNYTLVIVKNGRAIFETNSQGIRGLLTAIEKTGKELKSSSAADKIVGEAAAHLLAYSNVIEVFALTLSQGGKSILEKNNISHEYEDLVPHILNLNKTDLCPFEKLVSGCNNPKEVYEKLKKHVERIIS
jgi:hypothetical protein